MHKSMKIVAVAAMVLTRASGVQADLFGTGGNQFAIDFVPVSADTNPASGIPAGSTFTFVGVNNDYRMGTLEITIDQWSKFKNSLGLPVTGTPSSAYGQNSTWTAPNRPVNRASWYEAAQFVNWLNTSTGYPAAYKFTGTQGTGDYALDTWSTAEADNGTNVYRHKDAFYYLPTDDEWVKAAYWNGTTLQTYATKPGESLHQGDGTSGTGWNYYDDGYATDPPDPWDVGIGGEELNGTFDMMGNVFEWMESPWASGDYGIGSLRGLRGGSYHLLDNRLMSINRSYSHPDVESYVVGFRVASDVPEPSSLGSV